MTQSGFSNAVNDAVEVFKATVASSFATVAVQLAPGSPSISVKVPGFDVDATVDCKTGAVRFGGETVTAITDLLAVAKEVHTLLGTSPAAPVEPEHKPEPPITVGGPLAEHTP